MHRSGKEEIVCDPVNRFLQAGLREGLDLREMMAEQIGQGEAIHGGGAEMGRRNAMKRSR